MRTISVEHRVQIDASTTIVVSSEVIVADDAEVSESGREARKAMDEFMVGYAEDPA